MLYSKEKLDEALNYLVNKQTYHGNDYLLNMLVSPLRENILSWYPFTKKDEVLLVGGATSGLINLLCNHTKEVTILEYNEEYLSFVKEGYSFFDNLKSYKIDEINNLNYFDYIIVDGFIREFTIDFHNLLSQLKEHLSINGKILFYIDNKYGTKYESGTKDFISKNYIEIPCFTKKELDDLFCNLQLNANYFYPYPDCKFCDEIFTNDSLYSQNYGKPYINIDEERLDLCDEIELIEKYRNRHILDQHVNSYLIELQLNPQPNEIKYVKINKDRNKQFQIATIVHKDKVIKRGLTEESKIHIQNISNNVLSFDDIKTISSFVKDNQIVYPYLHSQSLENIVTNLIEQDDIHSAVDTIESFFNTYLKHSVTKEIDNFYSDLFIEYFGNKKLNHTCLCINNPNVDLILGNVFVENNTYTIIDPEWVLEGFIPADYIIWRCIKDLYTNSEKLQQLINKENFYNLFKINNSDVEIFQLWEAHFISEYVGSSQRSVCFNPILSTTIPDQLTGKLYIDEGNGFNEESNIVINENIIENKCYFSLDLSKFDHIFNAALYLLPNTIFKSKLFTDGCMITDTNAVYYIDDYSLFLHKDSFYNLKIDSNNINLNFEFEAFSKRDVNDILVENQYNLDNIQQKKYQTNIFQKVAIYKKHNNQYDNPYIVYDTLYNKQFNAHIDTTNCESVKVSFLHCDKKIIKLHDNLINKILDTNAVYDCSGFDATNDDSIGYEFNTSTIDNIILSADIHIKPLSLTKKVMYRNMRIYLDCGEGFKDNDSILITCRCIGNSFEIKYDLSSYTNIRTIRFDPVENKQCKLELLELSSNLKYKKDNSTLLNLSKIKMFKNKDPWIIFKYDDTCNKQIKIYGNIWMDED